MNSRKLLMAMFAVVIIMISYQDITGCVDSQGKHKAELPWPPRFVATGIVFGLLDILSAVIGDLAIVFGGGFVLAMLICTACPKGQCQTCNAMFLRGDCNAHDAFATAQPYYTPAPPQAQPQSSNVGSAPVNTATGQGFTPITPGQPAV